ncbi:MAG: hypothetical protein GDA42_13260 [Ekhidna sp.]|nr:hypothetical protein [Ekhidna sp.]
MKAVKFSFLFFGLCLFFLCHAGFAQKVRKTGTGHADVAGNISPVEAQEMARANAKHNALEQLGTITLSEIRSWGVQTGSLSEQTFTHFSDEFRIGQFRLIGSEQITSSLVDGVQRYTATATYEIDESDTRKELEKYFEQMLSTGFSEELRRIDSAFSQLDRPDISALEYSQFEREFKEIESKLNSAYINSAVINELKDDLESYRTRIGTYLRILDNYLSQGFITPYLTQIDKLESVEVGEEGESTVKLAFSFELKTNPQIEAHYDNLFNVVNNKTLKYFNKKMEELGQKYPQYQLGTRTSEELNCKVLELEFSHAKPIVKFDVKNVNTHKTIAEGTYAIRKLGSDQEQLSLLLKESDLGDNNEFELVMQKNFRRKDGNLLFLFAATPQAENPSPKETRSAKKPPLKKTRNTAERSVHFNLEGGLRYFQKRGPEAGTGIGRTLYSSLRYRPKEKKVGAGLGLGLDSDYGLGGGTAYVMLDFRYHASPQSKVFLCTKIGTAFSPNRATLVDAGLGFRLSSRIYLITDLQFAPSSLYNKSPAN